MNETSRFIGIILILMVGVGYGFIIADAFFLAPLRDKLKEKEDIVSRGQMVCEGIYVNTRDRVGPGIYIKFKYGEISKNIYGGVKIKVDGRYEINTYESIVIGKKQKLTLSDNLNVTKASLDAFGIAYEVTWFNGGK